MRLINYIGILLFLVFIGCEKKPSASFNTDKSVYKAGDTVKLTNTSLHGSTFVWTMPDGQTQSEKNALYVINPNSGFDQLTFSLSSKSKGHCKRSFNSTSIKVIPGSWYINTNIPYNSGTIKYPTVVYTSSFTNSFNLNANYTSSELTIYFPPNNLPPAGVYSLQTTNNNLLPNTCFILFASGPPDAHYSTAYVTGQIFVEYVEGTMHVYFTDIFTNPIYYKLSANLYYYI